MLTAAREEPPSVVERAPDQLAGAVELDRRDAERTRWGQDDQIGTGAVALDVVDQPAMGEQADRMRRHPQSPAGRLLQRACMSRGEYLDAPRAELDGMGDRRVVGDTAVHQHAVTPWDGLQDARDGAARQDSIEHRSVREPQLLAADDVDGDDMQRDRQLVEPVALDVPRDQPAQARIGHKVVARADEARRPRSG